MIQLKVSAGGSQYIKCSDDNCRIYIKGCLDSGKEVEIEEKKIQYEALTPDIAEISRDGLVNAKKAGKAKFKVIVPLEDGTRDMEVTLPVIIGKTQPSLMTMEKRLIARENIKKYD
ncbi:MAG TPA: hypothetical protein DDZ89_19845, partial [Clostridiales bacterium]|nr:hypothetical protein [Clostridiales bacterium]